MADFLSGLLTGGVAGAAIKWIFDLAVKRQQELVSGRRKMLIAEIDALGKQIDPLVKACVAYYGKPHAEGVDLAKQIRVDVSGFGRQWTTISRRLPDVGQKALPQDVLIRFRQAMTLGLDDSSRTSGLPLDHQVVAALFECLEEVRETFSDVKFKLN